MSLVTFLQIRVNKKGGIKPPFLFFLKYRE